MSFFPFLTKDMEVASSGKLVPIARIVNPINSSGKPANSARFFAPNTRKTDPTHRATVEKKMTKAEKAKEFELSMSFNSSPWPIVSESRLLRAFVVIRKK